MPTNFEKWRDTLTPEFIFNNCGIFDFCGEVCPAKNICKPIWRRRPFDGRQCGEFFLTWANTESKD
jgi:hypothetical protein